MKNITKLVIVMNINSNKVNTKDKQCVTKLPVTNKMLVLSVAQ